MRQTTTKPAIHFPDASLCPSALGDAPPLKLIILASSDHPQRAPSSSQIIPSIGSHAGRSLITNVHPVPGIRDRKVLRRKHAPRQAFRIVQLPLKHQSRIQILAVAKRELLHDPKPQRSTPIFLPGISKRRLLREGQEKRTVIHLLGTRMDRASGTGARHPPDVFLQNLATFRGQLPEPGQFRRIHAHMVVHRRLSLRSHSRLAGFTTRAHANDPRKQARKTPEPPAWIRTCRSSIHVSLSYSVFPNIIADPQALPVSDSIRDVVAAGQCGRRSGPLPHSGAHKNPTIQFSSSPTNPHEIQFSRFTKVSLRRKETPRMPTNIPRQ